MERKTKVDIACGKFRINGAYTYPQRWWNGLEIEGMLFNTRMVQGTFDDKNPETAKKWAYPDTNLWDPERNVIEFMEAMPLWKDHGVLCFTLNLQGGSPEGYKCDPSVMNTAFLSDGSLDPAYLDRLERILDRADELGMVVILGYFYFGQVKTLLDEASVRNAITHITDWVLSKGYRNVLIEINNECDINSVLKPDSAIAYKHGIQQRDGVHEAIRQVQQMGTPDTRLLVSTSFIGGSIPTDAVVDVADFILLHGNGVKTAEEITQMVVTVKNMDTYHGQPILFNEDDHFEFGEPDNYLLRAARQGASWGYYDGGANNYGDGFQSVPVQWGINTPLKKEFFGKVKEITGY